MHGAITGTAFERADVEAAVEAARAARDAPTWPSPRPGVHHPSRVVAQAAHEHLPPATDVDERLLVAPALKELDQRGALAVGKGAVDDGGQALVALQGSARGSEIGTGALSKMAAAAVAAAADASACPSGF